MDSEIETFLGGPRITIPNLRANRARASEVWRLAQVVELAAAIGELFGGLDLVARVARVERVTRESFGMKWEATEKPMAAIGAQGCWVAGAGPGLDAKDVIACADAELYRAKREGRNRSCVGVLK